MKKFAYEARDTSNNKVVKSIVQADSENAAAKLLIAQGLSPINLKEQNDDEGLFAKLTNRVTSKDRTVFSRQLSTLIGAGVPLAQSLHTVLDQTGNKKMQSIIQEIIVSVEGGKTLASSFAKYPDVFNKVFVSLVAAGEASGTMDEALKRIAAQEEKDAAIMGKIKSALTYPIIVLVVIMAVIIFMLVTVVPQIKGLYKELGKPLPFLTQVMVSMADFTTRFWWVVVIVVGAIVFFAMQYFKTKSGIKVKDTMKLNVPVFSGMFRRLYMSRLARTGQTLLNSGVSMLDMLRIAGGSVNNTIIENSVNKAAEKVRGGKPLSEALQKEDYITPFLPQMISIGEQSGKIDEMLGKTAQVYEDELDSQVQSLSAAIEPILMVLLAVVAGLIVGAVLFPIYGLVSSMTV
jgi:type IV pilus assembly protein PilC